MKTSLFIFFSLFFFYFQSLSAQDTSEFLTYKKLAGTWVAQVQDDENPQVEAYKWELVPIMDGNGFNFKLSTKIKEAGWIQGIQATHAFDKTTNMFYALGASSFQRPAMIKGKIKDGGMSYDLFFLHDVDNPVSFQDVLITEKELLVTSYEYQDGKKGKSTELIYKKVSE